MYIYIYIHTYIYINSCQVRQVAPPARCRVPRAHAVWPLQDIVITNIVYGVTHKRRVGGRCILCNSRAVVLQ